MAKPPPIQYRVLELKLTLEAHGVWGHTRRLGCRLMELMSVNSRGRLLDLKDLNQQLPIAPTPPNRPPVMVVSLPPPVMVVCGARGKRLA